jgi:hypothetical protein
LRARDPDRGLPVRSGPDPGPEPGVAARAERPASRLVALRIFRLGRMRNAYMVRGLAVWLGLRAAGVAFGVIHLALPATLFVLAVVAAATYLDARRREEDVVLGNLGIPGAGIVLASLPLPLLLELFVL